MFLSESCTNSASWCSTACTVKRLSTSWNYSRRCRITATSSIRHPTASTSSRTASPAQLLWPTGFLCGWSVGLEFAAGQLAESDYWRNSFIQFLKTFLFATYWCIQRIRGFTTMHYINRLFTYLLIYKLPTETVDSTTDRLNHYVSAETWWALLWKTVSVRK